MSWEFVFFVLWYFIGSFSFLISVLREEDIRIKHIALSFFFGLFGVISLIVIWFVIYDGEEKLYNFFNIPIIKKKKD